MYYVIVLIVFLHDIGRRCNSDEIRDLPGLKFKINFRHYSGYLNATNGKFLHYWFVESQRSPSTDPLLLWMNGGPGCSSLDGLLSELGPFHVKEDGKTLYENPFSWNKVANVIFLEAPAGVGYSYSNSRNYSTDDDAVSLDNFVALRHFFIKFPQFKKNDFYITGESYGGIYVPTLSVRVLAVPDINFKGFAIGNGYLDGNKLNNALMFFANYHGLVDPTVWSIVVEECCSGCAGRKLCNFTKSDSCANVVGKIWNDLSTKGINIYNLYAPCLTSSYVESSRYTVDQRNLLQSFYSVKNSLKLQSSPPCISSTNISTWLNQKSVRKALHIPMFLPPWDICSDAVEKGYRRKYYTMAPQVLALLNSGKLQGLIYNGDVDMACNFLGDSWFAEDLGYKVVQGHRAWYFNDQLAGFVKNYENLTFLTIKGSGHMVPGDKPGPAFKMISSFLFNKPY